MLTHSGTWWLIATCMLPMTLGQLSSAPHGVSGVQNKVQNQPQKQGETRLLFFLLATGLGVTHFARGHCSPLCRFFKEYKQELHGLHMQGSVGSSRPRGLPCLPEGKVIACHRSSNEAQLSSQESRTCPVFSSSSDSVIQR